jgi:hypothetical protein
MYIATPVQIRVNQEQVCLLLLARREIMENNIKKLGRVPGIVAPELGTVCTATQWDESRTRGLLLTTTQFAANHHSVRC